MALKRERLGSEPCGVDSGRRNRCVEPDFDLLFFFGQPNGFLRGFEGIDEHSR